MKENKKTVKYTSIEKYISGFSNIKICMCRSPPKIFKKGRLEEKMKLPKRRKYKDNPYTIIFDDEKNIYSVVFLDVRGIKQEVEISIEIYSVLNEFELSDLSQMNKDDLHRDYRIIDNTEATEIVIYNSSIKKIKTLEEIVEENIVKQELNQCIEILPDIQKGRIKKYYFFEKTYDEIAKEENCTKRTVKFSVDLALEKLRKKIKK